MQLVLWAELSNRLLLNAGIFIIHGHVIRNARPGRGILQRIFTVGGIIDHLLKGSLVLDSQ